MIMAMGFGRTVILDGVCPAAFQSALGKSQYGRGSLFEMKNAWPATWENLGWEGDRRSAARK